MDSNKIYLNNITELHEDYLSAFFENSKKEKPSELNDIILENNFRFKDNEI